MLISLMDSVFDFIGECAGELERREQMQLALQLQKVNQKAHGTPKEYLCDAGKVLAMIWLCDVLDESGQKRTRKLLAELDKQGFGTKRYLSNRIDPAKIKYVLIDLDGTICDFDKARARARRAINNELKILGIDYDLFRERFKLLEPELMDRFLNCGITKQEYRQRRFGDVLAGFIKDAGPYSIKFNDIYMEIISRSGRFDDVFPLLDTLREKNIPFAVLTNGPGDGQRKKLENCGIDKLTDKIFISEEVSYPKPQYEFYKFVLDSLAIEPGHSVMVGDSLADDYMGALGAGIPAMLLDRGDRYSGFLGLRIKSLGELNGILMP